MDNSPDHSPVTEVPVTDVQKSSSRNSNVTVESDSEHHTTNIYVGRSVVQREDSEGSDESNFVYEIFPCLKEEKNQKMLKFIIRTILIILGMVDITILIILQLSNKSAVSPITIQNITDNIQH